MPREPLRRVARVTLMTALTLASVAAIAAPAGAAAPAVCLGPADPLQASPRPAASVFSLPASVRRSLIADALSGVAELTSSRFDIAGQAARGLEASKAQWLASGHPYASRAVQGLTQLQSELAAFSAVQTGFMTGYAIGYAETRKQAIDRKLAQLQGAATLWTPPKAFDLPPASPVALRNPARGGPSVLDAADLAATCLELDAERRLARVTERCADDPCLGSLQPGDYPLLPDGRLLDGEPAIREYQAACGSFLSLAALTADGRLKVSRRSN